MKKEYDFSKGVRGKFYQKAAIFKLPVYLNEEIRKFVVQIAETKHCDVSDVVNDLLSSDMQLAELLK